MLDQRDQEAIQIIKTLTQQLMVDWHAARLYAQVYASRMAIDASHANASDDAERAVINMRKFFNERGEPK